MNENLNVDSQNSYQGDAATNRSLVEQTPVIEKQESFERRIDSPVNKVEALRASIRKSIAEVQGKTSEPVETQDEPTQEADHDEAPEVEATDETTSEAESATQVAPKSPTDEAPTAWTKKAKAEWSKLPDTIKSEIWKREQDVEKGIQGLKSQYQTIDQIRAKYEPSLKRVNVQFNDLIDGAGGWFVALSGPERVRAYVALGKQFGIDLNTLVGPQVTQTGHGQVPQEVAQYIHQYMQPYVQAIDQQQQQTAAEMKKNAAATVESWSKDKPYFAAVRGEMHRLLISGEIPLLSNGHHDLDGAYNKAIEPIMEQMQQVEAKRLEDQRQQRAKKQAAAASLASRQSPGGANVKPNGDARGKTVRESLRQAIQQLS